MEHITMVRDASRSSKEKHEVLVHGYHGCMAVACQSGRRKTVPLALKLWSSRAPGHLGENDEVLKLITAIMTETDGKGILVYDSRRAQTRLHAIRKMVPQDHRSGTRANRKRAIRVPSGIQGTVCGRPLLKPMPGESGCTNPIRFPGATA